MTKLSKKSLPADKIGLYVDEFRRAVTLLESKIEVAAFFRDLFTHTERQMLAKRLQVAKLLFQGASYADIRTALKVSDVTIGKISQRLQSFGDGYRIALQRLAKNNLPRQKSKIKQLWRGSGGAQILAGTIALGATAAYKRYKKFSKRRSASR